MKIKLFTMLTMVILFTACGKEGAEKNTQPNPGTLESSAPIAPPGAEKDTRRWCCWGWPEATACGYGFNIQLWQWSPTSGIPLTGTYYYEIIESGTNNPPVATGNVGHNGQTTWTNAIQPCTNYDIYFYHPNFGYTIQVVNITSDGCGNNWIC